MRRRNTRERAARRWRRGSWALLATAAFLIGSAAPAAAHPTLLATTPEAGYAVATAPRQVVMAFDEPVEPGAVAVLGDGGEAVRTGPVAVEQGGRRLVVPLREDLAAGRYVVRWTVTAQDGDVVESAFDFAVGTSSASLRGRSGEQSPGLPAVVLLRWLLFTGLAVAAGEVVGERLARRVHADAIPRTLVRIAAGLGAAAAAGLLVHVLIVGGTGRATPLLALEVAGFAAAAVARRGPVAAMGLAAVVAAEAWRNHLGAQDGAAGALLVAVHLAAVAAWVGTLVYVLRIARISGWRGRGVRRLVVAYARMALALVVLVAVTGTVSSLLLVPSVSALVETAYGRTLLAKLALVALVVGLAFTARRRLRRADQPGMGRAARSEAAALGGVLAATALLVSLPTPAPATEDLGVPLPATRPLVRVGTLAGQVAVGLVASVNQLELRLRVPDSSVELLEAPPPAYRVSARVSSSAAPATVALRPCGPGCLVGPYAWRAGPNHVDLRIEADGWHGGAALLRVSWPPQLDSQILDRVVAVMRAQPAFTVMETVTSDTSRPDPPTQTVAVDGPEFLAGEPYGDAPGVEVAVLPGTDDRTTIMFGLPAEGVHVRLEVDDTGRIVGETLAAPKHLIERTFVYAA
ncbi:MAG: copper resistance protein CopC [Jiangellaceae bacterium]